MYKYFCRREEDTYVFASHLEEKLEKLSILYPLGVIKVNFRLPSGGGGVFEAGRRYSCLLCVVHQTTKLFERGVIQNLQAGTFRFMEFIKMVFDGTWLRQLKYESIKVR